MGSHLVRALLARGDDVTVLDDFSTGLRENLAPVLDRITLVEGTLVSPADVARALEGADGVLHEGALPSVPKSLALPYETHMANVVGTLNLLDGARKLGVKRVVYAASSSAYGDNDAPVKSETLPPRPISPYAVQKLTGEYYCQVYHSLYGLETVALRYFNVFGPWQNPNSQYAAVIPAFITRILRDESPVVHGDGEQSRDFTYIQNVIEANLAALAAPASACGQVYNAACGGSWTLLQLIREINRILGKDVRPEHIASRAGDVRHSCADTSKATKGLGWTARISVAEGLAKTVDWYVLAEEQAKKKERA